jgi:hypothetical protein
MVYLIKKTEGKGNFCQKFLVIMAKKTNRNGRENSIEFRKDSSEFFDFFGVDVRMTLRIFDVNVSAVVAAEEDPDGLQKPGYQNFAVSQLVGNKILEKIHFIEAETFDLKVS